MNNKDSSYMLLVHKARDYRIVMSNNLIQTGILPELTVFEYRVFMYIVSCIKPVAPNIPVQSTLENSFEISFLCDVLGIAPDGRNYSRIKKAVKSLRDKSEWVANSDKETTISILSKCTICKGSGTVSYRFDEDIVPYLFGLCENTTRASLINILRMSRSSSYTLYLLCRSYTYIHSYTIQYTQLRRLLHIAEEEYAKFSKFDKYVLSVAVDDINEYSDITVSYSVTRSGRSAMSINFIVKEKSKTATGRLYYAISDYLDNKCLKTVTSQPKSY